MNRNYIKLFVVFGTVLLSFFTFLSTRYEYSTVSGVSVLLSLVFALPIFMHYNYNFFKNKKIKIPYLVIMIILYFIVFSIILLLLLDIFLPIAYTVDENNVRIPTDIFLRFDTFKTIFSNLLFMTTSWLMLLFNFVDLDKDEAKTNYVLTIIVSFIILLIHINFYINPDLRGIINVQAIGEKAFYIIQNYIYFGLMYTMILVNKLFNKIISTTPYRKR